MKAFFNDIFEYHHLINQKLADELSKNSGRIPERTIPLFSHTVNAHQIWNSRILQTAPVAPNQVYTLEACKQIDNSNYRNTLKILRSFVLESEIAYQNSKGESFKNSIREILFHVANHTSHHRGQIVSDMRQSGIVPIITDYIFYKR
ncbi:MAG: damage-inducible protein DinB [Sinomicrobium sp.]|nr:damage-inducible protein DinB [Sinomicrobium sp.]